MMSVFEQFHGLMYYGGWSLFELFNLPIGLRNWFHDRLVKQLEEEKENIENNKK